MWPLITQEYFDLTDQWPWEEDKFVKSLQTERGMPNAQSKVIKNPSSCLRKIILTLILYGLMTQQSFENIWIHVYLYTAYCATYKTNNIDLAMSLCGWFTQARVVVVNRDAFLQNWDFGRYMESRSGNQEWRFTVGKNEKIPSKSGKLACM